MTLKARAALFFVLGAFAALAAAVLAGYCSGCAHQPPAEQPPIVLPEREGSFVARAVELAVKQAPKAVTLPGLRTIVFQPEDASDECLMAHEREHRLQQAELGAVTWETVYVRDYLACVRSGQASGSCLRTMPLEAAAYDVQHRCQAARASGARSAAAGPQ